MQDIFQDGMRITTSICDVAKETSLCIRGKKKTVMRFHILNIPSSPNVSENLVLHQNKSRGHIVSFLVSFM